MNARSGLLMAGAAAAVIIAAGIAATSLADLAPEEQSQTASIATDTPLPAAYYRGLAAAESGDWLTASAAFEEALRENPDAPPLLLALGTAQIESGRPLLGAIHLAAYREAFANAPNITRVSRQIEAIAAIYSAMAWQMAAEAAVQLYAVRDREVRTRRSQSLVGRLVDMGDPQVLQSFASAHPFGATGGTLRQVLARGTAVSDPDEAYGLLRAAIDGEAEAAARDLGTIGCQPNIVAPRVCSVDGNYGEVSAGLCDFKEPVSTPGNRAAFSGYLEFAVAASLWTNGGPEPLVQRLLGAHRQSVATASMIRAGKTPAACLGWPAGMPKSRFNIVRLPDGSVQAWGAEGQVNLSRPPPAAFAALAPQAAKFRNWRAVAQSRTIDIGPDRVGISFDDALFGDLAAIVRDVGREPAEARAERLMELAARLRFLTRRLESGK